MLGSKIEAKIISTVCKQPAVQAKSPKVYLDSIVVSRKSRLGAVIADCNVGYKLSSTNYVIKVLNF